MILKVKMTMTTITLCMAALPIAIHIILAIHIIPMTLYIIFPNMFLLMNMPLNIKSLQKEVLLNLSRLPCHPCQSLLLDKEKEFVQEVQEEIREEIQEEEVDLMSFQVQEVDLMSFQVQEVDLMSFQVQEVIAFQVQEARKNGAIIAFQVQEVRKNGAIIKSFITLTRRNG